MCNTLFIGIFFLIIGNSNFRNLKKNQKPVGKKELDIISFIVVDGHLDIQWKY